MSVVEELKGKRFPVLDQGRVTLIDVMGDDHAICEAARLSYGKGTRSVSDDRTLIRHLMRRAHSSPFEMAELKFAFRMPQLVWWQMVRHRTASANVESGRYSEMSEDMMMTPPDGWRLQSTTNKQGSDGFVTEWGGDPRLPDAVAQAFGDGVTPGGYLSAREMALHHLAKDVYRERLDFGVAREQARQDLPLSVYINVAWKIDLHNLLHFLALRMDEHAQKEIRDYATIIGREIVAPLFPITWAAFCQYRLEAITLTVLDIEALRLVRQAVEPGSMVTPDEVLSQVFENKRERDECRAKLVRLGILD